MCELAAGFIHRPGGNGPYITDRYRLVPVVEPGGGGRRAESSGSARVQAGDVVEAVARAELVLGVELMIDFSEEVHVVNGVGIKARENGKSGIADSREPRIDDGDVRRSNSNQAALIEQPLFEVCEVERPVMDDGDIL